jgi:hypothetical protein
MFLPELYWTVRRRVAQHPTGNHPQATSTERPISGDDTLEPESATVTTSVRRLE